MFFLWYALVSLNQSLLIRSAFIVPSTNQLVLFYLFIALLGIVNLVLVMGAIRISLDFYAGEKPKFRRLFSMWPRIHTIIAASLLFFLMTGLGPFLSDITNVDWWLLLLIPGMVLGIIFWFYNFALVDKKIGPIAALKEGARVSRGARLKIFLFLIVLLLLLIAMVFVMLAPAYLMLFWGMEGALYGITLTTLGAAVTLLALATFISLIWLSQAHVYCKLRDFSAEESLSSAQ